MPSVKLTQRFVDSLGPSDKLILYFDKGLKGFGVYTTKNAKTYFIQSRVNGKEIKRTIRVPHTNLCKVVGMARFPMQ